MKQEQVLQNPRQSWLAVNFWKAILLMHSSFILLAAPYLLKHGVSRILVFSLLAILNIPTLIKLYMRQLPNVTEFGKALHYMLQPDVVSMVKNELGKDISYENKLLFPLIITFFIILAEYTAVVFLFEKFLN